MPDHLKLLLGLTPELASPPHLPAPLHGGEQAWGTIRSRSDSQVSLFCARPHPTHLFPTAGTQRADVCSCGWPWGVFLSILSWPSSPEMHTISGLQAIAHTLTFHLSRPSRRWRECLCMWSIWVKLDGHADSPSSSTTAPHTCAGHLESLGKASQPASQLLCSHDCEPYGDLPRSLVE